MELRLPVFNCALCDGNLSKRILSAIVLAPITLFAVYIGGWVYPLVVTLAAALGLREWLRLIAPDADFVVLASVFAALFVIMVIGAIGSAMLGLLPGIVFTLLVFLIAARRQPQSAGLVALGIPYMAGSGLALLALRAMPATGMALAFYLLAVVWGTDIGAYAAGRLIGGPKLAPAISPHKTWAGLFGGMALAALFGYGVAVLLGARLPMASLGLALLLAGIAQLGDLFKSTFKRRAGVKESGHLIPGHGGMLDRIDGLVFAAVFFVLFQAAIGTALKWW